MKRPSFPCLLLLALAVLAAMLRWTERSRLIYGWDSVHYLLAQDRYDLLAHQPHPPGSYYYVLLARLARLATGDPHLALLVLSSLFGGALVAALFHLGRELAEDECAGWLAAAIGVSAPLFWFYGSVALNYGPSATLCALVALGCVLACRGAAAKGEADSGAGERAAHGVLLAGVSLGVLGGFRPTDVVFLAPAYAWSLGCAYRAGAPIRSLALGPAVMGLLTVGWLLSNVVSAGGWSGYVASLRGQEHLLARSSVLLAGDPALRDAIYTHKRSLESLLGLAWLLVMGSPLALLLPRRQGAPLALPAGRLRVLGVLITLPAAAFYLFGHFNSPGYALTYGGFLAAVAACLASRLVRSLARNERQALGITAGVAALLIVGNGALFHTGWPRERMVGQRSLSAVEIRDHDGYYRDLAAFLRASHPPGTVRLLSSWNSTDGLRVVQTLLPEYAHDVAQAVAEVPELPPAFASLGWLRLMTPEQIRLEGRPAYLIVRTEEDPAYHESLFGKQWTEVGIGGGHRLYRLATTTGRRGRLERP